MKYAPIAIFIYNRPKHTERMLASLMKCPEFVHSPVYVFCDGPKTAEDEPMVHATRRLARKMIGHQAEFRESDQNRGPDRSIISAVSQLCQSYERVTVFEDDLIVAPNVLHYFNAALERYEQEERVMQISGFIYSVPELATLSEAFFLPYTSSWGWATWQRAWTIFDPAATGWEKLQKDHQMRLRFNLDGSYDYYTMLAMQMKHKRPTWDTCWYWSVFQASGVVLYPPVSYVLNAGFDGTGTHGWRSARYMVEGEFTKLPDDVTFPAVISIRDEAYHHVKQRLIGLNKRLFNRLRGLLTRWRRILSGSGV